jgi:hypothetical protein
MARMVALIIMQMMGAIGSGAVLGLEVWQSAVMAGVMGVATVAEALARAYMVDGNISTSEIDASFAKMNKGDTDA